MIHILSLPILIVAFLNFYLFIFYLFLYLKIYKKTTKKVEYYFIFSLLCFSNFIFLTGFGILLSFNKNLNFLNLINRILLIGANFTLVLNFHFIKLFFKIKKRLDLYILYSLTIIFSILILWNNPLMLYKEFYKTCSYYTGLKFGILYKIYGFYLIFGCIYTLITLVYKYIYDIKNKIQSHKNSEFLLVSNFLWLIFSTSDCLTSLGILDLPPLSWLGSFLVTLSIITILIIHIEDLYLNISQLYHEVIHDNLTKIYSRNYFEIRLNESINKLKRENINFYLVMIDIDDFKYINDNYGHVYGDMVLKEVAQIIKNNIRPTDILARYGGDEFIMLFENIPDNNTMIHIMDRIRESLYKNKFLIENKYFYLSCSIGVLKFDKTVLEKRISLEELIHYADEALYNSKNNGKNRVTLNDIAEGIIEF